MAPNQPFLTELAAGRLSHIGNMAQGDRGTRRQKGLFGTFHLYVNTFLEGVFKNARDNNGCARRPCPRSVAAPYPTGLDRTARGQSRAQSTRCFLRSFFEHKLSARPKLRISKWPTWLLAGWIYLIPLVFGNSAQAQSLEDLFETGNALYWEGKYAESVSVYTDLVEKYGVSNSQLYYNLGTACIRANKPGLAIFYLKRALKLSPSSALEEDIRANLELVRASLVERYRKELAVEQFVFDEPVSFSYTLFHVIPADVARWGLAGAWALLFVSLSLLRIRRGNRRWMLGFVWSFFGLTCVFGLFWLGHLATEKATAIGVIVKDNVALREGQHPNAPSHPLPEGLEVRIVDSTDPDLVRVQASNGLEGWVELMAVREI